MHTPRGLIIMKTIVGLSWLLGIAELIHPYLHIPPVYLWLVMALSVLAHAGQCVYFIRKFGDAAQPSWPHLLQIMVFGMPHIIGFQQRLKHAAPQAQASMAG